MNALASLQGSLNGWLDYFLTALGVMILAAVVIVFWAAVFAGKDQWQIKKATERAVRHPNFPTLTPPFAPPSAPEPPVRSLNEAFWQSPEPKRRPIRRPRSGYTEFLSDVTTVTSIVKGTVKFTIAHNDTKQEQTHWMSPCDAERIGRQMIHAASMARGDGEIISRPLGRLE
jgi:hypothetical protein